LHLNSWFGRGAHGAETYFLSRSATDQRAADAAAFENQEVSESTGDPDLGLELILWDLAQSYHLAESQRFANLVQEELNASLGLTDRGVKQAPFRVLVGASMPSVVVELGFLSNPEEASRLQNPPYRGELIDALVRATVRFKMQRDAGTGDPTPVEP
jgi:N-acetylmuramoyl-L-alanine amidase